MLNLCYYEEDSVPHIAFNNIECIFRKYGIYSYLVFYKNDKNKGMINKYVRIIDQIKDEIIFWVDEFEDDSFDLGNDFIRFRFRTDDNLVSDQKITVKVYVISLRSVIKKKISITYSLDYRNVFMKEKIK